MRMNGFKLVHESLSNSFVEHLEHTIPGIKRLSSEPEVRHFKNIGTLHLIQYFLTESNTFVAMASKDPSFNVISGIMIMNRSLKPVSYIELKPETSHTDIINVFKVISNKEKTHNVITKIKSEIGIEKFVEKILHKNSELTEGFKDKFRNFMVNFGKYNQYLFALLAVVFLLWHWIKQAKYRVEEILVETAVEKDINGSLFRNQKENDSAFSDYLNLQNFIKNTISGPYPAVIICGPPGTSKTHIVRRVFYFAKLRPGADYVIEKGATIGLHDIFALLYRMKKSILVLDDFDTPLKNADTLNFLKSITDSYKRRILSMPRVTMSSGSSDKQQELDIPQKFEYRGKIIMITNLTKKELDPALVSRCPTIEISFSTDQMIKIISKMITHIKPDVSMDIKNEVINYILSLYKKNKKMSINFRSVQNSIDARIVNPDDWREMVRVITGYEK